MSKIHHIQYIDDLDGRPIEDGDVSNVDWSVRGVHYHLDLTSAHAAEFAHDMEKWLAASALVPDDEVENAGSPPGANREESQAIRTWARLNGHVVGDRGRLASGVTTAFEAAHPRRFGEPPV